MSFVRVEVAEPKDFDSVIAEYEKKVSPLFVLFTGNKDEKGKSWCPDCVAAEPFLERKFKNIKEGGLITCYVERTAYKGNPNYAYRKNKKISLKAIPTIMKWGTKENLVEEQILNEGLLDMFFE